MPLRALVAIEMRRYEVSVLFRTASDRDLCVVLVSRLYSGLTAEQGEILMAKMWWPMAHTVRVVVRNGLKRKRS